MVNRFTTFAKLMEAVKKDIRSLTKEQLRAFFEAQGDKAFRGNQVYEWLWQKAAHAFEDMTNLSKETRYMLEANFVINHIQVDTMQRSKDGTVKNAVRLHDGLIVESVLIPTETRTTACVSSQVGCSLDCKFCATARLKRMRNLNPDEIYDQVVAIDKESKLYYNRPLSNIVFVLLCYETDVRPTPCVSFGFRKTILLNEFQATFRYNMVCSFVLVVCDFEIRDDSDFFIVSATQPTANG